MQYKTLQITIIALCVIVVSLLFSWSESMTEAQVNLSIIAGGCLGQIAGGVAAMMWIDWQYEKNTRF